VTCDKEEAMRVDAIMTRDIQTAMPGDTIQKAAALMDQLNVGALPVCDGGRLCGMITDRDITVRATSAGRSPHDCTVADVMSVDVQYCYEDDELRDAAAHMKSLQVRRLPVVNRANELVGLVSLGDMATRGGYGEAAETLRDVSNPSEPDRGH